MKTKILSLVIVAMIMFNCSFANDADNKVNETVLTSFSHQFEKTSDVSWTKTEGYYKANFVWNGQYLSAFYGVNGEAIAVSRNILPADLPIVLQTELAEDYSNYWVSDLFEYNTTDSNKYYLTVENGDKKIVLESSDNNYWMVFKKSTKS
jgi:hypothetical protein